MLKLAVAECQMREIQLEGFLKIIENLLQLQMSTDILSSGFM
jgi:hypothetical protein